MTVGCVVMEVFIYPKNLISSHLGSIVISIFNLQMQNEC